MCAVEPLGELRQPATSRRSIGDELTAASAFEDGPDALARVRERGEGLEKHGMLCLLYTSRCV